MTVTEDAILESTEYEDIPRPLKALRKPRNRQMPTRSGSASSISSARVPILSKPIKSTFNGQFSGTREQAVKAEKQLQQKHCLEKASKVARPVEGHMPIPHMIKTSNAFSIKRPHHSAFPLARTWTVSAFIAILLLYSSRPITATSCRDEGGEVRHCETICQDGPDADCRIRALVLLPHNDSYVASMQRVLPVLLAAEEHVHRMQLLPPHVRFDWIAKDDKCDASYAVIRAMDGVVKECGHVIFGPVCDYPLAAVGRIVKYFNSEGIPLISVGGSSHDFEKPKTQCSDDFYMIVRAGMLSFESLAQLTVDLMKSKNWSSALLYYETNGQLNVAGEHTCFLMLNSLGALMRKRNMAFSQYRLESNATNRSEEMRREIGNKHSINKSFWEGKLKEAPAMPAKAFSKMHMKAQTIRKRRSWWCVCAVTRRRQSSSPSISACKDCEARSSRSN